MKVSLLVGSVLFASVAIIAWRRDRRTQVDGYARASSTAEDSRVVYAIVVLAWLYSVAPPFIALIERGRQPISYGKAATMTAMEARVGTALSLLIAALCGWLIVKSSRGRPSALPWRLFALVLPWLTIELVSALDSGYLPGRQFLLFPALAVAFWLASPSAKTIEVLGLAVAATAFLSLVLAAATPLGLLNAGPAGVDKSILGGGSRLLAGPYNASNSLGLSLALGLPALLTLRWRRLRAVGLVALFVALLWAASRTSILAAAAVLLVYLTVGRRSVTAFLLASVGAVVAGLVAVIALPIVESNPSSFTQRGAIWIASLQVWHQHFWLGAGSQFYERPPALGFYALYGHNLFVDTAVRAGVLGLLGVAALLLALVVAAVRLAPVTRYPLLFAVALTFTSLLEVPLAFNNLGILGYTTWVPIALVLFTRDTPAVAAARSLAPHSTPPLPPPAVA